MADLRDGFREITSSWMMDGFDMLTERIEHLARWTDANGGLDACTSDEKLTIRTMIDHQIAMAEL